MPVSDGYIEYVKEQLEGIGEIVSKRMFGGVGLYCNGLFFALIENDTLRFKVDDSNRADYEERGMEPFRPYPEKKNIMHYYEVPVEVLEEQELLYEWAQKAVSVARAAKK